MKNLYLVLFIVVGIFFIHSCSNETNFKTDEQEAREFVDTNEVKVLNGRMYFPNKETFHYYYNEIKEKGDNKVANILNNRFYKNNFYSLKPFVNNLTAQKQITRHLNTLKEKTISVSNTKMRTNSFIDINDDEILDDLDDLEDVFGEELFTSFLNQEAEIQVDNNIYKYTDVGLFIVKASDINNLKTYLKEQSISENWLNPTEESTRLNYINQNGDPCGEFQHLDLSLMDDTGLNADYYVSENSNSTPCTTVGGNQGSNNSNQNNEDNIKTPSDELADIAENLNPCVGYKPFLGNLFGTTWVCKDKYKSKRRVKIKFYDVDLKLAYATGIKTKHQKKKLGTFWKKKKADEVAMGINSLSWKFNHATLNNQYFNNSEPSIYLRNGEVYKSQGEYFNSIYLGDFPMPPLPFSSKLDALVEFMVYDAELFQNEYDVRQYFYNHLFDTVESIFKSNSNNEEEKMERIGVILTTNTTTWIQFYDFSTSCLNCKKRSHVFDWGIATPKITYTPGNGFDFGSNPSFSFEFDFHRPKLLSLNGYGMIRKGNDWHGRQVGFEL